MMTSLTMNNRIDVKILVDKAFYKTLFNHLAYLQENDPYSHELSDHKFKALQDDMAFTKFEKKFCIQGLCRNGILIKHNFAGFRAFNDDCYAVYKKNKQRYFRYIGYRETLKHHIQYIAWLQEFEVLHYKANNTNIAWYESECKITSEIMKKYLTEAP